jgi:hypothetical protein
MKLGYTLAASLIPMATPFNLTDYIHNLFGTPSESKSLADMHPKFFWEKINECRCSICDIVCRVPRCEHGSGDQ